jgi:hypothetical protein
MPDYQTPNVIGFNLVTDEAFDADTNWVNSGGWVISGGAASLATASGFDNLSQSLSFSPGAFLKVSMDVTSYTSGSVQLYIGTSGSGDARALSVNAAGTYEAFIRHPVAQSTQIVIRANNGFTGSVDNFLSLKSIPSRCLSRCVGKSRMPTRVPPHNKPFIVGG